MPVECRICFEFYTCPGTDHAPYSAPCGHVMGKSCMEKLNEYGSNGEFSCPFCGKRINFNWCHPLYFMPDEFSTPYFDDGIQVKNDSDEKKEEINLHEEVEKSNCTKNNLLKRKDKITKNKTNPHLINNVKIKENCPKTNFLNFFLENKITNMKKNDKPFDISCYPYYYGKLARDVAENYLNSRGVEGDFLIRDSETNIGDYSISLKGTTKNRHYWIRFDKNTNEYKIGNLTFKSLDLLMDFYKSNPIYICEETNETLYLVKPLLRDS